MTADLIQVEYDVLAAIAARLGRESLATLELIRRVEQLAHSLPAGDVRPAIEAEILPALNRLAGALAEGQAASQQIRSILQQAEEAAARSS